MERPQGGKRGRKSRITAEAAEYLRLRVKEHPDHTLAELREDLQRSQGIGIGITQIWTVLRQMGLRLKKKSLHAAEQDSERIKAQRQFWQQEARQIDPAQLIFVDESGVTTEMTRRYGRALNGARVEEGVPAGRWRTLTILGAVSLSGWVAVMSIEAPTDGDVFRSYLEHVLCPRLKPGQLVVMDNLGAHKVDGVRELIEGAGAALCYLPPYSPDFNPIEKCWAQVKQRLRALKARSVADLQQALPEALDSLSPTKCRQLLPSLRLWSMIIQKML
jgi:transposase